jgi:protein-tyrosine phosphatase
MRLPDGKRRRLSGVLKAAYRRLKYMPDQVLHRRRHLEARARLLGLGKVRSILVVCYGNVCRSPYLQAVLARAIPAVNVTSAGFVGPDRPVPAHSLTLAASRGLDLSAFRSRPLARVNAREIDLVIVMDSAQRSHVARVFGVSPARIIVAGDLDPEPSATRAIADPWGKSLEAFAESFDRLDRCAATISTLMQYSHPSSRTPPP